MPAFLSLILHAHLPFVRHPEHENFLEESWLYETITETYLPLVQLLERWQRDALPARLTLTLTPTLGSMLNDALLRDRYTRRLENLIELAASEVVRTKSNPQLNAVAKFYSARLNSVHQTYLAHGRDLVGALRKFQGAGLIEVITSAATHALLPLLAEHEPSLRAQILVAKDFHKTWFGREPRGIWLPECAFTGGMEKILREAELRWFVLDTHGLLRAKPQPRYGVFAPVFTREGVAAFARDRLSAGQVWSRDGGYPGDGRYRDFYRDIGFELSHDAVKKCLPTPHVKGFTGIKYHRVTGKTDAKEIYDRAEAMHAADEHAAHFLAARLSQFQSLAEVMDRPAHLVAPYDAELFGHWWFEGPEFLDAFARRAAQHPSRFTLTTPSEYLSAHPTQQIATPAASSWGEGGLWDVWVNKTNDWIYPRLRVAQTQMTALAQKHFVHAGGLQKRALKQAARELLLAQSSDWPFILRNGTHASYARSRVEAHLQNFTVLHGQILADKIAEPALEVLEARHNIFPLVNYRYWA